MRSTRVLRVCKKLQIICIIIHSFAHTTIADANLMHCRGYSAINSFVSQLLDSYCNSSSGIAMGEEFSFSALMNFTDQTEPRTLFCLVQHS